MSTVQFSEEWRDVPGFSHYQASDLGRCRTRWNRNGTKLMSDWRILVLKPNKHGYRVVSFRGGVFEYLHRVILKVFVGEPPADKPHGRHFDGDPSNNRIGNLFWGTVAENMADKIRHGRHRPGEQHGAAKLTDEMVIEARKLYSEGMTGDEIAAIMGVKRIAAMCAITGKSFKYLPGAIPGRKAGTRSTYWTNALGTVK